MRPDAAPLKGVRGGCAAALLLLGGSVLAGAPGDGIRFAGGDGLSVEHAVVIEGAKSESEGVRAEVTWLAQHYPGARTKSQSLRNMASKAYDVLETQLPSGEMKTVYFDITGFFGKY